MLKKLSFLFLIIITQTSFIFADNAPSTDRNTEYILNRVWDGSSAIKATITGSISGSAITFVGCSDDIQTAITNATSGDTLILGACTYTFGTGLTSTKTINLMGQGIDTTILTYTGTSGDAIQLNTGSQNSSISNMTINYTGASSTTASGIRIDRGSSTVSNTYLFQNLKISTANSGLTGTGTRCINFIDAGGTIMNCLLTATISGGAGTQTAYCVQVAPAATAEGTVTCNIYNTQATAVNSGAATGNLLPFFMNDNGTSQTSTMNAYNCIGTSTDTGATAVSAGIGANGSDAVLNIFGGFYNGRGNAVLNSSSATVTNYGASYLNRSVSGTVTDSFEFRVNSLKTNVFTVATLPIATVAGRIVCISDATSATDCTTGGSSTFNTCVSNGTTWQDLA